MNISVKVTANAKRNSVEKTGENSYRIRVSAPAVEGKANGAVVELLSEYFDIPKSRIIILKGRASKNKIVVIQ